MQLINPKFFDGSIWGTKIPSVAEQTTIGFQITVKNDTSSTYNLSLSIDFKRDSIPYPTSGGMFFHDVAPGETRTWELTAIADMDGRWMARAQVHTNGELLAQWGWSTMALVGLSPSESFWERYKGFVIVGGIIIVAIMAGAMTKKAKAR